MMIHPQYRLPGIANVELQDPTVCIVENGENICIVENGENICIVENGENISLFS